MTGWPKLLDLMCGAGGAARGYQLAGFHVTGVDLRPQPRYAGDEFIQADALEFPLDGFDAVSASPPCQLHSAMSVCRPGLAETYPALIEPTRQRLQASGVPWVIENVVGAPLRNPVLLCGMMFNLDLYRHRLFECSFPPPLVLHPPHGVPGSYAGHWKPGQIISVSGNCAPIALARKAMGIDWMNRDELSQAIPPAYTEFIGELLLAQIPWAAAHVGARPATATRSSGSGGAAPRGDAAAALGSPVETEVARTARTGTPGRTSVPGGPTNASVSALPDDLDQVWQPLLWDRPNRRWHPVTTVQLSGGIL